MTRDEAYQKILEQLKARGNPSAAIAYLLVCLEALELIKFDEESKP